MTNTSSFKNVLHIGPNYIRHKGGMGAVIATYEKHVPEFRFVASYEGNYNAILNIPFFVVSLVKILWELCTQQEIKVLHIHGASFGSFYRKYLIFLLAKYVFGKKFVYHLHAAEFHTFYAETNSLAKKLVQHLINESDSIIVLSKSWENFILTNFTPKQVSILPNPVEIPDNSMQKDLTDDSNISFLFLGRIGDRKGLFDLLDVISRNRGFYQDNITLTIGGDGEVEKLQAYIANHQLNGFVNYAGWVDGKLKHELLNACDILLLPSYNEGLPIAILEAMSYGKPIIASHVGGIPEVVKEGINGYLITPGDKNDLENKIDTVIHNKTMLNFMGAESLRIVSSYDIREVLKQVQSIYKDLLVPFEFQPFFYHN
ncbi:MAG: glycosyltransferase family 4 protein [Dyadobacter sp.]|uniref:glycosyltransferase family 4 protein n=1 Tax=Dyadobacter sp. TaxID=1914288 RepID=UPI003264AE67